MDSFLLITVDNLAQSPAGSEVLQLLNLTVSNAPWGTVMRCSSHGVFLARHHSHQRWQLRRWNSGNPWGLPNPFITAMTETNALNKPVPARAGRLTVPVKWVSVSPVSKSVTFTVEWSADTFGARASWQGSTPVKLVGLAAVLLDAVVAEAGTAEAPVESLPLLQLSFQPQSYQSESPYQSKRPANHSSNQ